jgi:alpha-aminoadipic semialdehyde synthase
MQRCRLLNGGISNPFLSMGSAYMYPSLDAAKSAVRQVGAAVAGGGLQGLDSPLTFAFTGEGNVSQGAQEIFKCVTYSSCKLSQRALSHRMPSHRMPSHRMLSHRI